MGDIQGSGIYREMQYFESKIYTEYHQNYISVKEVHMVKVNYIKTMPQIVIPKPEILRTNHHFDYLA